MNKVKRAKPLPRQDVNLTDLESILALVKASGALDEAAFGKLTGAVETLAFVTAELEKSDASVRRLRRWLFGPSTENRNKVLAKVLVKAAEAAANALPAPEPTSAQPCTSPAGEPPPPAAKPKGHGRNGADAYTAAEKILVPHPTLKAGVSCPGCQGGKVYPTNRPSRLVRIRGMAPLVATVFQCEQLRCNACQEVFTAPPPPGVGAEKYDASATAMVGVLRYGTGLPFNRLEQVQANLGVPVPAATQWDLVNAAADKLEVVVDELLGLAAQSKVVHNDDTTMPVVELMNPKTRPKDETIDEGRTGMFTTGVVAEHGDGHQIALFFTGYKHAGENLAELLQERNHKLPPIIQMCDALSRNEPKGIKTQLGNCNVHARRNFVENIENFPEECTHVVEVFCTLYKHEAKTKQAGLSPEERLLYHQQHSGPLMEDFKKWIEQKQEAKEVEPNSALGKAMAYVINHWQKLTLFLREPGVPLDNNICERALKKAVMHRKNSLYYRTLKGARVGDIHMSLIHTAELCGADAFHYLTSLLRYADHVEQDPAAWLPWNYLTALAALNPAIAA